MANKQRGKTLLEHLGFRDPQLSSPAHDQLVLWISQNLADWTEKQHDPWKYLTECRQQARQGLEAQFAEYQLEIARCFPSAGDLEPHKRYGSSEVRMENATEIRKRLEDAQWELKKVTDACLHVEKLLSTELSAPETVPPIKIRTELEKAVSTDRDFIVGFVDVVAHVRYPELTITNLRHKQVTKNYRYVDEICGIQSDPEIQFRLTYETPIYFEAKPTIPSLGDLLRQIRTYQEYAPGQYVVVSPDTRYREVLQGQGVDFWESPT